MEGGKRRERVAGVLYGVAAGDKNGGPVRMSVIIGGELLRDSGQKTVWEGLERWFDGKDEERCFDTGNTFYKVLTAAKKMGREEAVERFGGSAGPNSGHRCGGIAMCKEIDDVMEAAARQSKLTHRAPESVQLSQIVAGVCRYLIENTESGVREAVEHVRKQMTHLTEKMEQALLKPSSIATDGGFCPECLGATLMFSLEATSFEEGLDASIAYAGPANYCPVLVGMILGCRFGRASFVTQPRHFNHISSALMERIGNVADQMSAEWNE